ncbi:Dabb family protein [Endothiovibrio diazotrophicus]
MLKHIVLWRLLDEADGHPKAENAQRIKQALEALDGRIPGLLRIEVGIDLSDDPDSADVALYSEFTDRAALHAYHDHPLHQAIIPLVKACRAERRVVDYEV